MKKNHTTKMLALAAAMLLPAMATAQHFGVGISDPTATLQIHSTEEIEEFLYPWNPFRDGDSTGSRFDPPDPDAHHYCTTLHMTNPNTGTDTADGLIVRQHDLDVSIEQREMGTLWIKNNYAQLEMTSYCIGIGNAKGGYKFNVEGKSRFTLGVDMLSWLNVAGGVTAGALRVSDGLYCDANGNMEVKHLKVTLNVWPDYVFGEGYRLMPLGELEAYIKENSHLPGVPSAKEVVSEGADVGEMNKVLMEKVEELTLYIIDLQRQIDELKSHR